MDISYKFKTVLIGDSGVGKSSIATRFVNEKFDKYAEPTIGSAFFSKTIGIDKGNITLNIWDTAGQEKYDSLIPMYYKGAHIIFLVFDVNNRKSFDRAIEWFSRIKNYVISNAVIFLIGNKTDSNNKIVSFDEGKRMSEELGITYYETSALKDINIKNIFYEASNLAYDIVVEKENDNIIINENKKKNKSSCFGFLF